jgi:hypothetical protein
VGMNWATIQVPSTFPSQNGYQGKGRVTVGMDGPLDKFHPHFHDRMVTNVGGYELGHYTSSNPFFMTEWLQR